MVVTRDKIHVTAIMGTAFFIVNPASDIKSPPVSWISTILFGSR